MVGTREQHFSKISIIIARMMYIFFVSNPGEGHYTDEYKSVGITALTYMVLSYFYFRQYLLVVSDVVHDDNDPTTRNKFIQ